MDVQELRNFARQQMDVDDRDLPDPILNVYLQEAFDRTMLFTNQWPRNETIWPLSRVVNAPSVTLPADLNVPTIISVVGLADGYQLAQMGQESAEQHFGLRGQRRQARLLLDLGRRIVPVACASAGEYL